MTIGTRALRYSGAGLLAAVLLRPQAALAQCAMCSTAIGSSGGFARGFAVSILFLLTTLLLMVLAFVGLVISRDRSRRETQATAAGIPPAASAESRWRLLPGRPAASR